MSTSASPATVAAAPAVAPAPAARRETRQIAFILTVAAAGGALLQATFGPGPRAFVVCAGASAAVALLAAWALPGRWRETLSGFRFAAVSTASLALVAVVGTLVVQGKARDYYLDRYGALGQWILALRLDDVFHALWFACAVGLFAAALVSSAALRFPLRRRSLPFVVLHAGLITTLLGGAASTALSVKGRLDLHAGGESATGVRVTGGAAGARAPFGFELRLDRFDLVKYEPELRIAYYEPDEEQYRLRATFPLDTGTIHLLPGGNRFRVARLEAGAARGGGEPADPAGVLELEANGTWRQSPTLYALRPGSNYVRVPTGVLVFERRPDEARSFVSHLTFTRGDDVRQARLAVNEPFSYGGWTFYQADYDARDRTYSGIDAVRDPGVAWVFAGFALIFVGVVWTFYGDGRGHPSQLARGAEGRR